MSAIASRITSLTVVYLTVYSDSDKRKHQSSASLAFATGINQWPVNSPHKWPVTRKMFPFDDVIVSQCTCLGVNQWTKKKSRKRHPPHCDVTNSSTTASAIRGGDSVTHNLYTGVNNLLGYNLNSQLDEKVWMIDCVKLLNKSNLPNEMYHTVSKPLHYIITLVVGI